MAASSNMPGAFFPPINFVQIRAARTASSMASISFMIRFFIAYSPLMLSFKQNSVVFSF